MDYTKSHQQRRASLLAHSSPSQTLWYSSENVGPSSGNKNYGFRDKGAVNVQVILRCRPLSGNDATPVVISCNEDKGEVTVSQNMCNKQIDKTFMFDKVYGPTSKQKDLYDQFIAPIVNEVLEGYDWTVFAYGQTGTGKTYTMEGGSRGGKEKNGEFHEDVGVIPRAVEQIFDKLEAQTADYSMKVTFIEIYNEEVTDLLASDHEAFNCSSEDKPKKPIISLMEDGKGAVFMRGLEEEMVRSADEIYKILEKGSRKKHTAETLLNTQSNRSHSLFTITVQVKETSSEGIELIRCGKLNLVDLAGSESILRSGAREGRAREAGEINRSLLTLGRVITALVEHSGHVPYRDSKLTRLLRDSLGGRTKTCIIATVSPSINSMEETLNTLDYAYRAKNIKNRPEVNRKLIKSALIKDLYTEIDSLEQELHATREKHGVYLPCDRYLSEEAAKKALVEKLAIMELDAESKDKKIMDLEELIIYHQKLSSSLSEKLEKTERELEESKKAVSYLKDECRQASESIKEKEYLIYNLLGSEKALMERAFKLHAELDDAMTEMSALFAKLGHKHYIGDRNKVLIESFQTLLAQHLGLLHNTIVVTVTRQEQKLQSIEESILSFASEKGKAIEELQARLRSSKEIFGCGIKSLVDLAGELDGTSQTAFDSMSSETLRHSSSLSEFIRETSSTANDIFDDLQANLADQEKSIAAFTLCQSESYLRTYEMSRSMSEVMMNFFKTLRKNIFQLIQAAEEARTTYDRKLMDFRKKFEGYADDEERQLLDEVAKLLASSKARKKQLVQREVDEMRDYIGSRNDILNKEMSDVSSLTSSAEDKYTSYLEKTEKNFIEDTNAAVSRKDGLMAKLGNCTWKTGMAARQWTQVEESLVRLHKGNTDSIDSIIREATRTRKLVLDQFSSTASSTREEADVENRNSVSFVQHLLGLDLQATEGIKSVTSSCRDDIKEMENAHSEKIAEIIENAEKCLINDYIVDESSSSFTPREQPLNLLSMVPSIEELSVPAFEELLKTFRRRSGSQRQENRDFNTLSGIYQDDDHSIDSTTINGCTSKGQQVH